MPPFCFMSCQNQSSYKILMSKNNPTNFFEQLISNIYHSWDQGMVPWRWDTLYLTPVSRPEILNTISNLNNSNTPDLYGLSSRVFKTASNEVADILEYLINECFVQAIFPDCLKIAKIIPIHKNGSMLEASNYRPISILPVVAKMFEQLIKGRIVKYLEVNNILCIEQFGYRQNKSTVKAAIELVEFIAKSFDNNLSTATAMVDLSKAFDCVSHNLFCKNLSTLASGVHLTNF